MSKPVFILVNGKVRRMESDERLPNGRKAGTVRIFQTVGEYVGRGASYALTPVDYLLAGTMLVGEKLGVLDMKTGFHYGFSEVELKKLRKSGVKKLLRNYSPQKLRQLVLSLHDEDGNPILYTQEENPMEFTPEECAKRINQFRCRSPWVDDISERQMHESTAKEPSESRIPSPSLQPA